ncbi:helix-turn-helix domain-containing protein [Poseidonibacter lekithochrous]|uniref:helix-turn-helix domain-containing protein n=1 Tax=Poseidonibacter TaxID=2321187 RepID=UPI001C096275|nr:MULTISPECIES: helix-turn-helix domain-containing protein [Poseidonibacter]MBU3015236.1 helix-turn-helix domain-containing protein [Poseidonibacter lekithochrous]MDO6828534.1 helix-turn-helix domain-containing protein [Poseidonibacter sp. 1_MG-2023]
MERLVTTTQAAQILGLSLQGVHYRIKKNQLKSIKQSGKIFVYITDKMENESTKVSTSNKTNQNNDVSLIIEVKDEQIALLKKSQKWMKKQYISEINRLERNQKDMMSVLNSEIKLLQSAFNEMRSIYKPQIEELKKTNDTVFNKTSKFITLKEFTLFMKRNHKSQNDIKLTILNAIKDNDERFIYNKSDKKLLILNSNFEDLL